MRGYITLSKSGHYTVTITGANKRTLFKEGKISSKLNAQMILADQKNKLEPECI